MRNEFGPNAYNLITKNCNSFANAFVWALLRRTIPPHVNRLAEIGSCCSCLFPKKLLEAAPVDDNSHNSSGYQVSGGHGRISSFGPSKSQMVRPSFSGTGRTLGQDNASSSKGIDDLTDRREKARKAALARLEMNGKVGPQ